MALAMAILGSSVLPVSYAFATTGILAGFLISLVVALCNTYTCQLLLHASLATRTTTFEELTHKVGGRAFRTFAQAANIVLLLGNLTGDMCLLADLGQQSLVSALGGHAPSALVAHHGRGIMLLLTAAVILPLSLFRGLRALEYVSCMGMAMLAGLFGILTADASASAFRGVTSGEVPLWTLNFSRSSHMAEAFALIGFSFYVHPLMMPLLQELPPGKAGVRVVSDAVTVVIMGVALLTYSYVGAMGAAAFGAGTEGDIMMNQLVADPAAAAALAVAMLVYLASCMPPLILSLRTYVDFIVAGPRAGFHLPRFLAETVGIVALPIVLAWSNPQQAEKAFALTGATGVCIVCYVVPIVVHLKLLFASPRQSAPTGAATDGERLLPTAAGSGDADDWQVAESDGNTFTGHSTARPETLWEWLVKVGTPVLVLIIGCGLSGLALYDCLRPRRQQRGPLPPEGGNLSTIH